MKALRPTASTIRLSTRLVAGTGLLGALAFPRSAFAELEGNSQPRPAPAAAPSFYAAAFVATTLVYRPYRGSFLGPQGDVTPLVGFGYFATAQIALELDVGATFASGGYVSTSFTPGVVWAFHPHVYAAGRIIVPVHPELNMALYPGIGTTFAFGPLAPFLEMNLLSTVGRGEPDLGLGGSAGALYSL